MMMNNAFFSPLFTKLVDAFCCLPGVGPRSAQRMVFYLLQPKKISKANNLTYCLQQVLTNIQRCSLCNNFSENKLCNICQDNYRQQHVICVVESVQDAAIIEQTGCYKGRYYILNGSLSPIDGLGPEEIGLYNLEKILQHHEIEELILATNSTIEGEATAQYIAQMAKKHHKKASRLAQGMPVGAELEFVSPHTVIHALAEREEVQ